MTIRNASGYQYIYEVDGTRFAVTQSTMDAGHGPHWQGGKVKPGPPGKHGAYKWYNEGQAKVNYGVC